MEMSSIFGYVVIALLAVMAIVFLAFAVSFASTREWEKVAESLAYALSEIGMIFLIAYSITH
jgi:Mn2+/Fe2+ NRAMP family transporter